jgi:hypothetical protein
VVAAAAGRLLLIIAGTTWGVAQSQSLDALHHRRLLRVVGVLPAHPPHLAADGLRHGESRLVIEARWVSKPLVFAAELRPRRLNNQPF